MAVLGKLALGVSHAGATQRARLRVEGVPQAIAKLRAVGSIAGRDAGLIVRVSAFGVRDRAREIVHSPSNPWPERNEDYEYSGNLRDGIEVSGSGGRAGGLGVYTQEVTASSRAGGSDREYAAYEELGTHKTPAHPYMRPALASQQPKTIAMLRALAAKLERL